MEDILMSLIREVLTTADVSTVNSSATPLTGDATFTGTSESTLKYAVIVVSVYADVVSATDGLVIEQSKDGTNWDHDDKFTIPAAIGKTFSFQPQAEFFRVKYTNGSGAQATFRLSTVKKKTYVKPSSHRIQDSISTEDDAELVKSVLSGEDSSTPGTFRNVKTTVDGTLNVSDQSSGLAIAKGEVTGSSLIHKFGEAPDFDTGDGVVTIWDGADDGNIDQMVYQYSTTADIDSISSSDAGDAVDIYVEGLDASGNIVTQTPTLSGNTRVALATSLKRVHRMYNADSTDLAGHVYCYVNTALSSGVPIDTTKVRAVIQGAYNQTLMCVYTVPTGYTAYLRDWYAGIGGGSRTSNYVVYLYARPSGGVFQLKHKHAIAEDGTSSYQHKYEEPETFAAGTDIEMRVAITAAAITAANIVGGFDIVLVAD
jgi:hypothetical protein